MNEAPRVDYRKLSGYGDVQGEERAPPPYLEPESRSEGDMRRNSFRGSRYHRLTTLAVANDDGTPITATLEGLLREILAELQALRQTNEEAFKKLQEE
jgi:hypothetical protein